jgi:hypothetical protein
MRKHTEKSCKTLLWALVFWIGPQITDSKSKNGQMMLTKTKKLLQKSHSIGLRESLPNGRKYLQMLYLTRDPEYLRNYKR